ncbi:MAG: type 1 glutamine amidotransferase domain-containing protein [Candidatus Sericytochromatia bacterium]
MRKIAIALSSHIAREPASPPAGYLLAEVSRPYLIFREQGYEVTFVSPLGGAPPVQSYDLNDPVERAFAEDPEAQSQVQHSLTFETLDISHYAGIFLAGGYGAIWDFPDHVGLQQTISAVYEGGGVVGAVCHGVSGLLNVKLNDGRFLLTDKTVTGLSAEEENAWGLREALPFVLERQLEKRGAIYRKSLPFEKRVMQVGRLITGQNPASAPGVAQGMVTYLESLDGPDAPPSPRDWASVRLLP